MLIKIIIKCLITYFTILLALKFMGKREVGQLNLLDFAIILIIADILVIGIESDAPFYYYVIPIIFISLVQKFLAFLLLKFPKLRSFFDGKASIIIFDGKINIKEMRRLNYNMDDLITQLRLQSISSLSEIKYAVLETNGKISVFKYENKPISPFPLIISGEINKENANLLNISDEWIYEHLKGNLLEDVMYGIYENDNLYIVSLRDKDKVYKS